MRLILLLSIFVLYSSAYAAEVNKITFKGNTVKVGQTSDDAGPVLSKWHNYKINHEFTYSDPSNPSPMNIVSTKAYYKADGKKFFIVVARTKDPGPFRITKIVVY